MSLNNLSIRIQVLIPLLLASLLMMVMIAISKQGLDEAISDIDETTQSVVRNKDDIARLIHATYRLRTSAIYGLYDAAQFAALPANLNSAEQEITTILARLVIPVPNRITVRWPQPCRPTLAIPATTCCRC